ncbi:MAG: molybdopterin-synthase adenylyltransferase MoeB [Gammaproteobacteria bacterium]|nr:MAG: molybdopterin-synthase adenylyltransferase MoeB [Gammaproteobacteria bacterium]RKZ67128.1 MAG: molybdopterin-synthase adenylyltransferase MoeB [Gammaproteobacteria bacterium]
MNNDQLLRYSRQMMLPEIDAEGQQRLTDARVLIIGLGGLGSSSSVYLAAAGVGHLVLVDFDEVDISNLQRQIVHATKDIGRLKVDSAAEHLLELNPEIQVTKIDHKIENEELEEQIKLSTVVLDCSDNFQTRFAINDACVKHKTPLVSGAAIRFEAQVSVFDSRHEDSPCYRCLYGNEAEVEQTCTANGVISPLLGIVGSIQACEAMKIIMNLGETLEGRLLLLDVMHMEWHTAKLNKDPNCPVCSR